MMTFERMQTESDYVRPETSKFSRGSNRVAALNTTAKGFNTKQLSTTQQANSFKNVSKNETSAPFSKNKSSKSNGSIMSMTSYDQTKSKGKASNQQKKNKNTDGTKVFQKQADEPTSTQPEQMLSSQGFQINSSDLKQGITLDKVLGGGFKKIDIFSNSSEFETPEFFPTHIIDEKINELSDPEESYRDDEFEIIESENEEEANNNSRYGDEGIKKSKRERRVSDSQEPVNKDLCDRINRKYKHRGTKGYLNRKSSKSRSPEPFSQVEQIKQRETEDDDKHEQRNTFTNSKRLGKENHDEEIRNLIASNLRDVDFNRSAKNNNGNINRSNESRSLSPKAIPGGRKPRFQRTYVEKSKKNNDQEDSQISEARQTFSRTDQVDGPNPFRATSNTNFRKTNFEGSILDKDDGNERDHSFMQTKSKKQGFGQGYGTDSLRDKNYNTSTQALYNPEASRMRDTGTRFNPDKTGFKGFDQKNTDNNKIADRIKQHELEMLEKYSKNKISDFSGKHGYKYEDQSFTREGSNRRLSTPIKEGGQAAIFQRRKFHCKKLN